jgi:tetratricopeptide (TPR) repeat protein
LFNKGIALDGLQQYDKAIECFNACIELNDQDELAYIAKGNALDNMKHSKQAIREYDRAIQINEKNESVFFNKGI